MGKLRTSKRLNISYFFKLNTDKFIFFFLLLIVIIFSATIPNFFSVQNFGNISRQIVILGVISVGMTFVILSRGIDLSVGSIFAFATCLGGVGIQHGWPLWAVYCVIIVTGIFLGSINGFLISTLSVPSLIITLGTMNIYRGIAMVFTDSKEYTGLPTQYMYIGVGYRPVLILVIVVLFAFFILNYTKFGRHIYAIGGDERAAKVSGVPVEKHKIYIYMMCGLLSAIAGIIFVGRSGVISPLAGKGYEMDAIAAVVVGGTSVMGGYGSVIGTLIATILVGVILAGLTMTGIDPVWKNVITGALILTAMAVDITRYQREA